MQNDNLSAAFRRSSRVPAELPILVTTLAGTYFSEVCKTLVVNAHGCALQTPLKFDAGVRLRFHSNDGRETTARVVSCEPIGADNRTWRLAAQLDRPENFWGLSNCPEDWAGLATVPLSKPTQIIPVARTAAEKVPDPSRTFEAKLDIVAQRLEAPLKRMIAASLAPLEAQIAVLKEAIARREANPSRFEVSLSSIPPELEQQLEGRLRKNLEPRVLQESRQQYATLLESAKSTVDQQVAEGYKAFLNRAAEELKVVEKRAQELSAQIAATLDAHSQHGLQDLQQRVLDGGNSLKRLGEELLEFLQNNLDIEYKTRLEDLEQLRASVAAESSRLRQDIERLDGRVAKLGESARSLESGLDERLSHRASDILKEARSQFENMAAEVLDQFIARSSKVIEDRLTDANGKLATTQKDQLSAFSQTLQLKKENELDGFAHSMQDLTELSVDRWRIKFAGCLNALAKIFGEQFQLEIGSSDGKTLP
jgi:hypothetical protein